MLLTVTEKLKEKSEQNHADDSQNTSTIINYCPTCQVPQHTHSKNLNNPSLRMS